MKQKIVFMKVVLPSLILILLGFICGGGLNYTLTVTGSKNPKLNGVYVMANKNSYGYVRLDKGQVFKRIGETNALHRLQNSLYISRNDQFYKFTSVTPTIMGNPDTEGYMWSFSEDMSCVGKSKSIPKEVKCENGSILKISKLGIRYQDQNFMTSYPILIYLVYCPVTCIVFILCVIWHLKKFDEDIDNSEYCMSYETCVVKGEYMRIFYSAFSHGGFLHLAMNMMMFCSLYILEEMYGSYYYLCLLLNLTVLTGVTELLMSHILIYYFNCTSYYYQSAVGFSGVIFALMSFFILKLDNYCPIPMLPYCFNTYHINLYFFKLPVSGAPFLTLILIQILIPNVSFIGHLSGIVLGYLTGWGWFNYVTVPLSFSFLACLSLYQLPTDSSIYKIQGVSDADEDVIERKFPQKYTIATLLFIATLPLLYFNDYSTMLSGIFLCSLFFYTIVKYFRYHRLVQCNFYMRAFIICGFTLFISMCYDLGFDELFSNYSIIGYSTQVIYLALLLVVLIWSLDLVIGTSYVFTYHPRQVIRNGVISYE